MTLRTSLPTFHLEYILTSVRPETHRPERDPWVGTNKVEGQGVSVVRSATQI